jgi:aspartate aminotransferase
LPGIIVSNPDAAIYSVIDVRDIAKPGFDGRDFVNYCTKFGKVAIEGKQYTLLVAPMEGFYNALPSSPNPGVSQLRVAYVESPAVMKLVPHLFTQLFQEYEHKR